MRKEKGFNFYIPLLVLSGLVMSGVFFVGHFDALVTITLQLTLAVGALPLLWRMLVAIARGRFGVDLIAIVAIVTAFVLQEYLAGAVITLMLSGGEALEGYAMMRARRELTALLSRAPTTAHLKTPAGIRDVTAAEVVPGQVLIIKPGEAIPVDGLVVAGVSGVDESALTGESMPQAKRVSDRVLSGSVNRESVLEIRALKPSLESSYELIIKLVRDAEKSRAPVVRLADRYSVWFTGATFVMALAAWVFSQDPVRLLAVLVVATPCPLILATPIAMISGISRAAARGIIVKSGGALERLAQVRAFIFDKTGTLTLGTPRVVGISAYFRHSEEEVIQISASLDQLSAHVLARALVAYAGRERKLALDYPGAFREFIGDGVLGEIGGKQYFFGKLDFLKTRQVAIPSKVLAEHFAGQAEGKIAVYLGSVKRLLGAVYFADVVRPEIRAVFENIKLSGVEKIVMLTGDRKAVAETIGKQIGVSDIHAECLPEQKVEEVADHKRQFGSVVMVGDGINDAPALSAADVGIAIGSHGASASSDASDIVITVDNLARVGEAFHLSKRVLGIAKQGIFFGMGASVILMFFAAAGFITPVGGALLQEVLDVAVIFNALRVIFIRHNPIVPDLSNG